MAVPSDRLAVPSAGLPWAVALSCVVVALSVVAWAAVSFAAKHQQQLMRERGKVHGNPAGTPSDASGAEALEDDGAGEEERTAREERLLKAAEDGDVATVHRLMTEESVDVDARDLYGWTALHVAATMGRATVVEVLIKSGCSVDASDKDGSTPLHKAASEGHASVVEVLIKSGCSVDASSKNGLTPLHKAAFWGHASVVELLIKSGCSVDASDASGSTALHYASSMARASVVELLLKSDAAVDVANKAGDTALHTAAWIGHLDVVERLLKANASVESTNMDGLTPLMQAKLKAHDQIVKLLTNAGLSVELAEKCDTTPLHKACRARDFDVIRSLLQSNENPRALDKDGFSPLHTLLSSCNFRHGNVREDLRSLRELMVFGATWDTKCDKLLVGKECDAELALWASHLAQEQADGIELTDIPEEVFSRGVASIQTYIDNLKSSENVIHRRKICLVGPSCAGKTSFGKSITRDKPELTHMDNRTIGIDHFSHRFEQYVVSRDETKIHEVTFWDFAGQDAYQVAHSLFFSPRTLFLVCVDIEAFTLAYAQSTIMAHVKKHETQLMDEFIERAVMQWIRIITARQPDAEFKFIATKEDLLKENTVTERLLKDALVAKLNQVSANTKQMSSKLNGSESSMTTSDTADVTRIATASVTFASCTAPESVQHVRAAIESMITKSNYSFQMPDAYTQALDTIVAVRMEARSHDITTRIDSLFAPIDLLAAKLHLKPEQCRSIVQTLHDLGDVLWYEKLGVELFQDRVILDPLLIIDFIRPIINHKYKGQTMPHANLKDTPYWMGLRDEKQMEAMKQVLQKFKLVYSASIDRKMAWNSDLIVPAYWQTKTPAAWLFLGDILRINDTWTCEGEAIRVHWEYHFEFGLPSGLFDQLIVASISPFYTFDAGPDWVLYKQKEIAACRIMVGRDRKSIHRTIHVEAVVAEKASAKDASQMWDTFQQLVGAFVHVLEGYPGLLVSSFAWDDKNSEHEMSSLVTSRAPPRQLV